MYGTIARNLVVSGIDAKNKSDEGIYYCFLIAAFGHTEEGPQSLLAHVEPDNMHTPLPDDEKRSMLFRRALRRRVIDLFRAAKPGTFEIGIVAGEQHDDFLRQIEHDVEGWIGVRPTLLYTDDGEGEKAVILENDTRHLWLLQIKKANEDGFEGEYLSKRARPSR
jgi:hypothetical protein